MIEIVKILMDPITKRRVNPLHDFFFKKMFGEKGCEKIVSHLIEAILKDFPTQKKNKNNPTKNNISHIELDMNNDDVNLKKLVFLNPHVNADTIVKKGSIMDVKVETDKFIINIESQVQKQAHFGRRLFFYITRMFPKSLNKGKNYNELKRIMGIAILDYEIKNIPEYHDIGGFDSYKYQGVLFENIAEYHTIQVPRLLESQYNLDSELHRLLIFLNKDSPEKLFKKVIEMDEVLKETYDILDNTLKNEKEMEIYETKLKAEMDYNSNIDEAMKKGKEEGIVEGREEAMIAVAKKMKEMERPVEEIAKLTNLSKEKIMRS